MISPLYGQLSPLRVPTTMRRVSDDNEANAYLLAVESADGLTTFLGYLLYSDFPNTGSVYDSAAWEISRTIFNAAGTTSSESSATGSWSNKTNLQFS